MTTAEETKPTEACDHYQGGTCCASRICQNCQLPYGQHASYGRR